MHIEELFHNNTSYFIGITEFMNTHNCTKDNLLELAIEEFDDVLAVQFLNPLLIVDTMHLLSACQNAINAWNGDYAISRSIGLEIVVYASAQKQIGKALAAIGVHDNMTSLALVIVGKSKRSIEEAIITLRSKIGEETSNLFEINEERISHMMDYFRIGQKEIETLTTSKNLYALQDALSRCVRSRVSLVALEG